MVRPVKRGLPAIFPAFCRGTRVPGTGAAGCFLAFLFFAFLALAGGLHVDLLGELGQLLVGFLLFFESFLEKRSGFVLAKNVGIGAHGAVGGDFVMLHALRGRNQSGVERVLFQVLIHHLRSLFDEPFHALALLARRFLAQCAENLLQALDVPLGLFQMFLECRAKLV